MEPSSISWHLAPVVSADLIQLKEALGPDDYAANRKSLQSFLCGYFESETGCLQKQGSSIAPLGATTSGGKILKVRWALPGRGKSGGLRLVFVARCSERVVILAGIFNRREDPPLDHFLQAAEEADH